MLIGPYIIVLLAYYLSFNSCLSICCFTCNNNSGFITHSFLTLCYVIQHSQLSNSGTCVGFTAPEDLCMAVPDHLLPFGTIAPFQFAVHLCVMQVSCFLFCCSILHSQGLELLFYIFFSLYHTIFSCSKVFDLLPCICFRLVYVCLTIIQEYLLCFHTHALAVSVC